jgi:acyl phosphate:glycerol-3-phosphate acyltransferase
MELYIIATALLAYLIGAIPTGYLIAKLNGIADIRAHGSGNIGATNVARFLGKHYFFIIFFIDAGKAFLCMYFLQPYFDYNYLCLFAAILLFGNGYSIFLHGSGGKGVATICGLIANVYPTAFLPLFAVWLLIFFITHTVGIASVGATACLPLYAYSTHNNSFFLFSLFAATLIIWKHKSNIQAYRNMR